jgi:NhaC family Na+:H+ antiporter
MSSFNISPLVLIPPFFIIILPLFKVNIKLNMLIGIIIGGLLAVFVQKISLLDILSFSIFGYNVRFSNDMLYGIIKGGGILSMLSAGITIAVSSALNGIFEGTGMLEGVLSFFTKKIRSIGHLVFKTFIMSLASAMYGCSQALSIMLTGNIMKPVYKNHGISPSSFARTIADTCVVLSPLIPWNIAGLVPAGNMGVRVIDFVPYAFFCLIMPIITIIFSYTGRMRKSNTENIQAV